MIITRICIILQQLIDLHHCTRTHPYLINYKPINLISEHFLVIRNCHLTGKHHLISHCQRARGSDRCNQRSNEMGECNLFCVQSFRQFHLQLSLKLMITSISTAYIAHSIYVTYSVVHDACQLELRCVAYAVNENELSFFSSGDFFSYLAAFQVGGRTNVQSVDLWLINLPTSRLQNAECQFMMMSTRVECSRVL